MIQMTGSSRLKSMTPVYAASAIWNAAGYVSHPLGTDECNRGLFIGLSDMQLPKVIAGVPDMLQGISEGNWSGL